jgi:hypothetical protein
MFDLIAAIAGVLLSLIFSYVPVAKRWFARLDGQRKRLVMLGLLALVSLGSMGLACSGWGRDFGLALTCDRPGVVQIVTAFMSAVVANQTAYTISPRAAVMAADEVA